VELRVQHYKTSSLISLLSDSKRNVGIFGNGAVLENEGLYTATKAAKPPSAGGD
jgi:hypothetical protein